MRMCIHLIGLLVFSQVLQVALAQTPERTLDPVVPVETRPVDWDSRYAWNVLWSDGWQVLWDDSKAGAIHPSRPWRQVTIYQPDADGACDDYDFAGRVLSVVGSLVSFATHEGFYCEGSPRPRAVTRFRTVDLRTGADVDIRLLVPDAVVVEALKQDDLVKSALGGRDPADLQDLIDTADGGCEVDFGDLASAFAFYDSRDDRVTVRFGLSHGCEALGGSLTEITVDLPTPTVLDFGAGHLMKFIGESWRVTLGLDTMG